MFDVLVRGYMIKIGVKQLVKDANKKIQSLTFEQAQAKLNDTAVQFIDIRDIRELEREGMIPNAFHAPRGMLEFWVDPESPYFKPIFGEQKEFVLYCQSGWRSALATATLQNMGLTNVAHISEGFNGWKKGEGTIVSK